MRIDGLRAWHFPRDEWGSYAGHHPASSVEAIVHLRQLYAQGARYLVFPATAAWWLEHYRELADLLDSAHELKLSQRRRVRHLRAARVGRLRRLRRDGSWQRVAADGDDDQAGAPTQLLTLTRPAPRRIAARADDTRAVRIRAVCAMPKTRSRTCSPGRCRRSNGGVDRRGQRAAARVRRRARRRLGADRRRQQLAGVLGVRSRARVRRRRHLVVRLRAFRDQRLQHALRRLSRAVRAVAAGRGGGRGRRASVTSTATTSRSRSGRITPSTGSGRASSSCRRRRSRRSAASCRSPTAGRSSAATRTRRSAPMRRSTGSIANTSRSG